MRAVRATFLIAARVGHRHCIKLECFQQLCIRRAIAKKNRNLVRRGLFRSQAIQRQTRQIARRWDLSVPQMGRELAHERQALTLDSPFDSVPSHQLRPALPAAGRRIKVSEATGRSTLTLILSLQKGEERRRQRGSWSRCMRKSERSLSMNYPNQPATSKARTSLCCTCNMNLS